LSRFTPTRSAADPGRPLVANSASSEGGGTLEASRATIRVDGEAIQRSSPQR
jgi:hypothetical protein